MRCVAIAFSVLMLALTYTPLMHSQASANTANLTFTTIDFPGATATVVFGINSGGEQVGAYYTVPYNWHGFLFAGGQFTTIDYPGAQWTIVAGVNDGGQMVGYYAPSAFLEYGFLYDGNTFTQIQYSGQAINRAQGISSASVIVGTAGNTQKQRGFELDNGTFRGLQPPGVNGYAYAEVNGINVQGEAVGFVTLYAGTSQGFTYSSGKFKTITYPGAPSTEPYGINDNGLIVGGYRYTNAAEFGFAMRAGKFVAVNYPGAASTVCIGINLGGQIVGTYIDSSGLNHGFVSSAIKAAQFSGQ